jgi:hypothetical protein
VEQLATRLTSGLRRRATRSAREEESQEEAERLAMLRQLKGGAMP